MTKNFDTLLEQMLSEMMPADIEGMGGLGGAVKHIKSGIPQGKPKGHFAPLQKLSSEDQDKVLEQIFKEVFSEKENTYAPTVDSPEELHGAIQTAIQKISGSTELKAAAKYASKFLADRMMTLLKNNVKYTSSSGVESLQKEMTQKEFKQALKQALEEAPKEQTSPESEEKTETETDSNVEKVYFKAPDFESDDSELQKTFSKLPSDKDMSWEEVVKTIKMSPALALLDAGGLVETEKEVEAGEEEYGSEHKELDLDDEDDADLSKFDRLIDPYFRTTKGSYELPD
jgi:membrane carboxypeptidase/penicillin-binding protein